MNWSCRQSCCTPRAHAQTKLSWPTSDHDSRWRHKVTWDISQRVMWGHPTVSLRRWSSTVSVNMSRLPLSISTSSVLLAETTPQNALCRHTMVEVTRFFSRNPYCGITNTDTAITRPLGVRQRSFVHTADFRKRWLVDWVLERTETDLTGYVWDFRKRRRSRTVGGWDAETWRVEVVIVVIVLSTTSSQSSSCWVRGSPSLPVTGRTNITLPLLDSTPCSTPLTTNSSPDNSMITWPGQLTTRSWGSWSNQL